MRYVEQIAGAAMLSIITLMQAGLPLASARSIAAAQIGGPLDMFAVAAQRRHHQVVARRQQLAAVHAVRRRSRARWISLSAFQRASLPSTATNGSPRRTAVSNSAMWKPIVPSPSTANTGAFGSTSRAASANDSDAADRAGDAVDQAAAHRQHALAPLRELAAVADQHGVGIALDKGLQRAEHLGRMQPAWRLRDDVCPRGGPVVEGCARLREPIRLARSRSCRRAAISVSPRWLDRRRSRTASRSPFSVLARSTSAASGSMAIRRHVRIERRAGRPLGGEVERLAEQHDQVGAPDQIGERAERGVGDAARAFHDDGGRAGRGFESGQQCAAAHGSTSADRRA